MIAVKRSAVPVPAAMRGKKSLAAIERAANLKLAALGKFGEMTFAVYRDPSVMKALDQLFHRKCAYCEASLRGQQPGDREHFRPKGKVSVRDAGSRKIRYLPGYYWLAAEWSNLLPACLDCNRPRTQEIFGQGRRVIGKANWFPVADERRRARTPRSTVREPRLLLDPCVDDPGKHLAYTPDGAIEARKLRGQASAMGRATIETCGLARVELMQARAERGLDVDYAIKTVLAKLEAGQLPSPIDIDNLHRLLAPTAPFSAYARFLVETRMGPYLRQLGI